MSTREGNDLSSKVTRIVDGARRCPTAENCQDWSFVWDDGEGTLVVRTIEERGRYFLNCGNTWRLVSLGFLLEHLDVLSAAEGLAARVDDLGLTLEGSVSARVSFHESTEGKHALHDAIMERFVDRRSFAPSTMDDVVRRRIGTLANKDCSVQIIDTPSKDMIRILAGVEIEFMNEQATREYFLEWTRMTLEEADRTQDGVYWKAWQLPPSTLFFLRHSFLYECGRWLGATWGVEQFIRHKLRSSHFLCIRARLAPEHADNLERLVDVGRLVMRAWLTAVQAGYTAQPFSLSVIIRYYLTRGLLTPAQRKRFEPLATEIGGWFEETMPAETSEEPIFIVRFGTPRAPYPHTFRTRRLDLSSIFSTKSPKHPDPKPFG